MINYFIDRTILIDCLLIIILLSEANVRVEANERAQVGICQSYDIEHNLHYTNCFAGNYTKIGRKYCCTRTDLNASAWLRVEYCCNIDEFSDQYSWRLLLMVIVTILSLVIFFTILVMDLDAIMQTLSIDLESRSANSRRQKEIGSKKQTKTDREKRNEKTDKNNEANKKKGNNGRISSNNKRNSGNSGNINSDPKPRPGDEQFWATKP